MQAAVKRHPCTTVAPHVRPWGLARPRAQPRVAAFGSVALTGGCTARAAPRAPRLGLALTAAADPAAHACPIQPPSRVPRLRAPPTSRRAASPRSWSAAPRGRGQRSPTAGCTRSTGRSSGTRGGRCTGARAGARRPGASSCQGPGMPVPCAGGHGGRALKRRRSPGFCAALNHHACAPGPCVTSAPPPLAAPTLTTPPLRPPPACRPQLRSRLARRARADGRAR
jgi:hypothetical protein